MPLRGASSLPLSETVAGEQYHITIEGSKSDNSTQNCDGREG